MKMFLSKSLLKDADYGFMSENIIFIKLKLVYKRKTGKVISLGLIWP
jgi:hypothetical protein